MDIYKTYTAVFILITILIVIFYDIFALNYFGENATISKVIRNVGNKWPMFPPIVAFSMGALYGHFFL